MKDETAMMPSAMTLYRPDMESSPCAILASRCTDLTSRPPGDLNLSTLDPVRWSTSPFRKQLTNIIGDIDIESLEGAKEESFEAGVVLALSLQCVVFGSSHNVLNHTKVLNKFFPVVDVMLLTTTKHCC